MQAVVEHILAMQPDVRAPAATPGGWSALHLLLDGNIPSLECAEMRLRLAARLINAGAAVADKNGERGATVLHVAVGTGNHVGVQWLLGRADGRADNRVGGPFS